MMQSLKSQVLTRKAEADAINIGEKKEWHRIYHLHWSKNYKSLIL